MIVVQSLPKIVETMKPDSWKDIKLLKYNPESLF